MRALGCVAILGRVARLHRFELDYPHHQVTVRLPPPGDYQPGHDHGHGSADPGRENQQAHMPAVSRLSEKSRSLGPASSSSKERATCSRKPASGRPANCFAWRRHALASSTKDRLRMTEPPNRSASTNSPNTHIAANGCFEFASCPREWLGSNNVDQCSD